MEELHQQLEVAPTHHFEEQRGLGALASHAAISPVGTYCGPEIPERQPDEADLSPVHTGADVQTTPPTVDSKIDEAPEDPIKQRFGHLNITAKSVQQIGAEAEDPATAVNKHVASLIASDARSRFSSREIRMDRIKLPKDKAEEVKELGDQVREWRSQRPGADKPLSAEDRNIAEKFAKYALRYAEATGCDIVSDQSLVRAMFDRFADDADTLRAAGFRNPETTALYADPKELLQTVAELPEELQTMVKRSHTVIDLQARAAAYQRSYEEIQQEGLAKGTLKSVLRHALVTYQDPATALRRYHYNMETLPTVFAEEPLVDKSVINRYAMRPDAEGEVRDFLARAQTLGNLFADNSDFTTEVIRELALKRSDINDPDRLRAIGNAWHQRYTKLANNAAHGEYVDEGALGLAAISTVDDAESRLRYAQRLTYLQRQPRRAVSLQQEVRDSKTSGRDRERSQESVLDNPNDITSRPAVDQYLQSEEHRDQLRLLDELLSGLSPQEQDLLHYTVTGELGAYDDEQELAQQLGVRDLGSYAAELIQRIRKRANIA